MVAWPVGFNATWASWRPPSTIDTAPAAGSPSAPVTFTSTVDFVCPARSLVETLIEVSVDTLCAFAAVTGSTSNASVTPSPATNLSRRLRRFMPLTCTCSKFPEESRITLCLSVEDHCIWPGRGDANQSLANRPEKRPHRRRGPHPRANKMSRLKLDAGRHEWRVPADPARGVMLLL